MKLKLSNLFQNELIKSILTLFTGTVLSQVITFLLSPIFSRLYNETDFADFGLYTRVVAVVGIICTFRYENTLPLPKKDEVAKYIFRFVIKLSFFISLAFLLLGFITINIIPQLDLSYTFILLVSLSTFFISLNLIGVNWSLRKKEFLAISSNKLLTSISGNSLRVLFGFLKLGGLGLIFSSTLSYIIGIFNFRKLFPLKKEEWKIEELEKNPVKEYRSFAAVGSIHALVDFMRDLILALLITYHFGKAQFGQYAFSLTMLAIPLTVVGQVVGQVFYKKMIDLYNSKQLITPFLIKTILVLISISFIPFLLLFFYAEDLFVIVFGEKWSDAGNITQILTIWYFFNFIISPISNLPLVIKKQTSYFFLGLISSLIQVFCLGVLPYFYSKTEFDFHFLLELTSIVISVFFIFCCLILIFWSKQKDRNLETRSIHQ